MTPEELAKLAMQRQSDAQAGAALTAQSIARFQSGVSQLIDDIEGWLKPLVDQGTARIFRQQTHLNDSTAKKTYQIETAVITVAGKQIKLQPQWLYGIGACCKVEFTGFKTPFSIFRDKTTSEEWLFSKEPRSPQTELLTQDVFLAKIGQIL